MKAVNLSLPSIEIAESDQKYQKSFGSGMKNWPHFVTGTLPPIGWIKSVKILINGLITELLLQNHHFSSLAYLASIIFMFRLPVAYP